MTDQHSSHGEPSNDGIAGVAALLGPAAPALIGLAMAFLGLLIVLVVLIARTLQVLFVLVRYMVLPACTAVAVCGAAQLFWTIHTLYGADVFSCVLAFALTLFVPASCVALTHEKLPTWPALLAAGAVSLLLCLLVERSPPTVLALAPPTVLGACVVQLAFEQSNQTQNLQGGSNGTEIKE